MSDFWLNFLANMILFGPLLILVAIGLWRMRRLY